jgi:hypothetical protein
LKRVSLKARIGPGAHPAIPDASSGIRGRNKRALFLTGNFHPLGGNSNFPGLLPPQRSARKDGCLSVQRKCRLCSKERSRRVEKCEAREGITISKG